MGEDEILTNNKSNQDDMSDGSFISTNNEIYKASEKACVSDSVNKKAYFEDLENLKGLESLDSVERLKDLDSVDSLDSLDSVESLKGIKSIKSVDSAESLKGIESLDSVENLKSFEGLESLESLEDFEDLEDECSELSKNDQELVNSNSSEQVLEFIVSEEYNGIRIDKYLSLVQSELTRSYIQKLIDESNVSSDGKLAKANLKCKTGSHIIITVPRAKEAEIVPENLPIDIIYEDKDIIIINKQKGLVVHPAAGHASGTLVNALLYHCKGELSGINGILRPGIVHRIDRDTTGVIVACKNDKAHQFIAEQLKVHSITRKYYAIVYNIFKTDGGRVEAPIGRDPKDRKKMAINHKNGKAAVTNYRVIENLNHQYSFIECSLETGRTHQIRVHMASIHHPLLGDTVYGPGKDPFHLEGQALHAGVLGFIHPSTGKYVEFEAPLPDYFTELLDKLRHKG